MNTQNKLHGLVLSGGESRRMGRDKGLILTETTTWVNRAGTLLQNVNLPISVLIREAQRPAYIPQISLGFELLSDLDLPVGGPLKGFLSFHARYPQADVLTLPCDMPNLTADLLRKLIGFYAEVPEAEAWVFELGNQVQPFPGIYSARLLAAVSEKASSGELPRHGLVNMLGSAKTESREVEDKSVFQNFNSPVDL